ncbi:hypothetical protein SAMN05720472_2838 [Fibrobacter sp. UWR3]|uniref:hypothetical protein n=1 Tax=Fibrobacter sp. UWR3 TaxID=1896217 RepID=UPI000918A346|nr:hypothetical protein [Fibrobacter sp. UWR3]SHM97257.1 hypothetical protein SAMN05720472_2838 [Fibrobacter sp. UWR3]
MACYSYKVAGHVFTLESGLEIAPLLDNYAPFAYAGDESALFSLKIEKGDSPAFTEETRQDEEGQQIICGHTQGNDAVFEFRLQNRICGTLVCEGEYRRGTLYLTEFAQKFSINNSLMVFYALATARHKTALFHSAVIKHEGYGYMFLGKSGTGKSTHARLWLENIEGTELLNDDNPVVRVFDNEIRVFGSPWSGKTPCYKNDSCALGGIVLLIQAPYNKIERLRGIEAYAALVPSISGKRWDKQIADGLHETENALAMRVPTWYLECLPDADAANTSYNAIRVQEA